MQKSRDYLLTLAKEKHPKLAYDAALPLEHWQEKAREKLEELLGLPLPECEDAFRITSESEEEDFKQIEFEFMSEPGHMTAAILRISFGERLVQFALTKLLLWRDIIAAVIIFRTFETTLIWVIWAA